MIVKREKGVGIDFGRGKSKGERKGEGKKKSNDLEWGRKEKEEGKREK